MAFHYQNLIQENDFNHEDINEKYKLIKKYAAMCLKDFRKKQHIITSKHIWRLAIDSSKNACLNENGEKIFFQRKEEKILIITNILIPDDEYFVKKLFSYYNVDLEKCYKLKDVLNELDKNDKDYLDGTMEGLVRYYIPSFDAIAKDLGMNINDEFIIYKLMEIMYFNQELLEMENQKIGNK